MDSKKCLVNSLKKLGLVAPIALALSSSAFSAVFSPIDQPLESDFFAGVSGGAIATSFENLVSSDAPVAYFGGVFLGKNLVSEDGLVAGVVGQFLTSFASSSTQVASLGAYVAYDDSPDDKNGLKLGLSGSYARDVTASDAPADGSSAQPTPHLVGVQADESYAVELADVAGGKVFLTQFAGATATKALHVEDSKILPILNGGLKLSVDVGGFSTFLSASAIRPFTGVEAADKFTTSIGGGLSWKVGEHAALKFDVAKTFGGLDLVGAGIGLDLLF